MKTKTFDTSKEVLDKLQFAMIKTQKGNMSIRLFPNEAPNTVANFASLAQSGFYDNLNFHRVIAGFVAQGGCPEGSGRGGPGYSIACELENNPHKHLKGTLSMAHAGRDTGGSQFFICFAPQPHLDGEHTIFGQIEDKESLKVLDSLKEGDIILTIIV
ncbi:peptidylprolyl isomerase [Helicobacter apodemus]|uniref:Peptidyl-prolyl cis-trans isomerase n=1 Tax=Helicobacter apodemus TaxID=135569 RepID=A0A4U8UH26_9HELI|nr:peptidylprolyl isomerase [Helicobacter apodemus]MDE6957962.1 peptidylprolyl isomerase [Helicobacter apodemus]TLE15796.1 peptidylprolyl isomerase [Helicobacter apodemus]